MPSQFSDADFGSLAEMLEAYDTNKDGQLDAQEKETARGVAKNKRRALMDQYDTNKDGVLDPTERQAAIADLTAKGQGQPK